MNELNKKRSVFIDNDDSDKNINIKKQLIGLTSFIITFVVAVPYLLYKSNMFGILEGYIPNVDMIATVIGFQIHNKETTKDSYFKYLYNPNSQTKYGYFSQLIINYFALLGLTFFIAYYTFKSKSISSGWSRAFIMVPATYLLPGNFIAYYMEEIKKYLDKNPNIKNSLLKDVIIYIVGLLVILFFIFLEKFLINKFGNYITNIIKLF